MPKLPRIPFAFAFESEYNQQNGNSVAFAKKINIYNFYVYHRINIRQMCIDQLNGNLVVHMKIVNIYIFQN